MQQTITPNPNIPCKPGWCLAYVNQAFRVPIRFGSATAAWNGSTTKHRNHDFPTGVWTPLWFSLATEPNGHVALRAPDGRVFSTTHPTALWPTEHPNMAHLINAYARYNPLTYLGWTEDVEGTRVMAPGLAPQGNTITPITSEEDDMTAKDVWDYPITIDGKEYPAHDVLRYARLNAALARETAEAAPALAVETFLTTVLASPDGSGRSYTVAEYLTYGWWYAMQAKDKQVELPPLDLEALTSAVTDASAAAVAARLQITVKEG